jgi:CRP-like cAMP-binding protein
MTNQQKSDTFDTLKLMGAGTAFRQEMCNMIETTHMFRDFEWNDIEALADYLQAYEANAGTNLFREGDSGDYLCLVIQGKVDIYKEDLNQQKKIVASIGPGKTLGEMAIIDGELRSATAVVAIPTTLTILTKNNFLRIIEDKPMLAAKILLKIARLLSQRLRQTSGILVDYLEN